MCQNNRHLQLNSIRLGGQKTRGLYRIESIGGQKDVDLGGPEQRHKFSAGKVKRGKPFNVCFVSNDKRISWPTKQLLKEEHMRTRKFVTICMIAAFLMTVAGAELALARGGGGKGGGSCNGRGPGPGMSQAGNLHQYQDKQQNRYQHRQGDGTSATRPGSQQMQGKQNQLRSRQQLRDPATHLVETAE